MTKMLYYNLHSGRIAFKVPYVTEKPVKKVVIGVFDMSPSMRSMAHALKRIWNNFVDVNHGPTYYTIPFSTTAHTFIGSLPLTFLNYIEQSGTNIHSAFEKVTEVLANEDNVTIIFVSDGIDNAWDSEKEFKNAMESLPRYPNKLIEFFSIGVGTQFPTFLSMLLRNTYHTGRYNIPNMYVVKTHSDFESLTDAFNGARAFIPSSSSVIVEPPVQNLPWEIATCNAFECSWVLCTPTSSIRVNGRKFELTKAEWETESATEIFSQWLSRLHSESLKDEHEITKAHAILTHALMLKVKGVDGEMITSLIQETKNIADGNFLNREDPIGSAVRMSITSSFSIPSRHCRNENLEIGTFIQTASTPRGNFF